MPRALGPVHPSALDLRRWQLVRVWRRELRGLLNQNVEVGLGSALQQPTRTGGAAGELSQTCNMPPGDGRSYLITDFLGAGGDFYTTISEFCVFQISDFRFQKLLVWPLTEPDFTFQISRCALVPVCRLHISNLNVAW